MDNYKKKITEYEDTLSQKYSDFDYDAEADELFRLQRAQLARNQQDGVSDILARYAANTGMGGSSAAMSAAQQTASKYNSMIADALTAAEEKAYSRWATEKADLENKIASTKQDAHNEAAARFSLGDLSGYQGLGYDTSAYEAELERQRKAEADAAAATARQTALAEAQARAQYGDLSGLKALGIDTSAYEAQLKAQAEASKEEVGINGMTKSQYDAQMERWLQIYKSSDDEDTKTRALAEMDNLYNGYFGYYTPAELEGVESITDVEAKEIMTRADQNNKYLSPEDYKKLCAHFYRYPIDGYRGEALLSYYGYRIKPTETAISDEIDTTHGLGDDVTEAMMADAAAKAKAKAQAKAKSDAEAEAKKKKELDTIMQIGQNANGRGIMY